MSCSYCRCQGHNVRLCNDPTITAHYNNIKGIYISIRRLSSSVFTNKTRFNDSISRYTVSVLKAVVAKFVGGSISLSKKDLIHRLWGKLFVTIIEIGLEDEWIERVTLPNIPDVIPAYAQDLAINHFEMNDFEVVTEFGPFNAFGSVGPSSDQRLGSDQRIGSGTRVFEILRNARASRNSQISAIRDFLQDYVAFGSRNLDEEFGRNLDSEFERINIPKKYNISTCISVTETAEELDKCEDCSICFEETKLLDTVTINCGHKFCGTCITNTLKMYNTMAAGPACAFCRSQMTSFTVKNLEIYSLVSEHCIM